MKMKRSMIISTAASIAFALVMVSGIASGAAEKTSTKAAPDAKSKKSDMTAAPSLSGKVVETMNAGGYTYVCIEKKGKKTWVAVPDMKVTVGKEMSFQPGQEMPNFTSKSLGRTFDSIIFSGGPISEGAEKMPAGHPGSGTAMSAPKSEKSALAKGEKIEKAAGPDAYTVGEIYTKKKSLNNKTVLVRGKVVKASSGIMGTNWLHLQDGSGDAGKSTNDLVVTTDETANAGEVVTVKGMIAVDKDFGAGYNYKVIMEKASIQR